MFAALRDDDDDTSTESSAGAAQDAYVAQKPSEGNSVTVPAYEDLSSGRLDEATVLSAVYGVDFSCEKGVWNYPCWKVKVKPPDITDPQKIGSRLQLHLQLNKKYPYVVPKIDIQNVTGLSPAEQNELRKELHERATGLAQSGAPMMIELVQVAEDYLLAHNRDPTMSAWEQMQEREKHQRLKENEAAEALDKLMAKEPTISFEENSSRRHALAEVGSKDVEKELLRQQEAIEAARRLRSTFGDGDIRRTSSGTVDSPRDEDDFDIDLDYNPAAASISRYETDFIEMGILGRGGGGEVVKARNRLDGRIYAIKKILLEREDGAMAKFGALQNQKLRREVTTVSRMTHNNIVRYYQAWVEGDGTEDESTINPNDAFEASTGPVDVIQEESDMESESSESKGWWTSTPNEKDTKVSNFSSEELKNDDADELSEANKESDSGLDIFDNDFGMQDPLMSGLGFENTLYRNLVAQDDSSQSDSVDEISDWDDESSSVKIGTGVKGRKILYIQMEFCSTTLRKLIDDRELEKMEENEIWRLIRQILEALAYIHGRKLIHRDLKPGNIFLDGERNIRLGDFGLATKHKDKAEQDPAQNDDDSETSSLYQAIEDISRLVGSSKSKKPNERSDIFSPETSNAHESMTGGVGTTFYRAPELEGGSHRRKGQNYTVQADIFSLGVVLFEMFHAPFSTYMERAENLTLVRGDHATATNNYSSSLTREEFQQLAAERFPARFKEQVPENAQRLILWCLSRDARRRPSAEELLNSDLLPRKIELEQRYLSEALQLLTIPQSESYMQILDALFQKPVKDITALTYDTDVAVKATNIRHGREGKRTLTPSESLLRAVSAIRSGAVDISSLSSLAMSDSSLMAATAALKRASNTGKLGKGGRGMLKRATQRTAGVLAMRAATSAAVTGSVDGVHGADPQVTENICQRLQLIFENHGAVRLRSPLLRPRVETVSASGGGPAELLNTRGVVLVLPEDLTVTFARAIGRGGSATSNIKRYDIDRVYHKSLAGGHPREALQASFDIVHEDHGCANEICTEALLVASKVIEILPSTLSPLPTLNTKGPPWFIRINHTRLTEAILDLCFVPPDETARRAALAILGRFTAATTYAMKLFLRNNRILVDTQQSQTPSKVLKSRMEEMMSDAEKSHGLPHEAVQRLRRFIGCCGFLSPDAGEGVERIKEAVAQLRQHCMKEKRKEVDPRLLKRFEDAARSLKTLRDVIISLKNFLEPLTSVEQTDRQQASPLFISIDFGMRQRRKHYHGGIIFQCIVLPDDYLQTSIPDESNEFMISPAGMGVKVAEGGDFTDLVRRHRPPGNFGSAFLNRYTASPIPFCCGIRFYIGKLVELAYVNAIYENETTHHDLPGQNDVAQMRRLLGHPLSYSESIRCIVASIHGMDVASVPERLQVARLLWSSGISAEYLPHSGIMLSLLKRIRDDTAGDNLNASDWSLTELYGVCALLAIPYVVIVQPHLLRDKRSVRLRRINCDSSSNQPASGEMFVELDHLATTIKGNAFGQAEVGVEESTDLTATAQAVTTTSSRSSIDCIYVDNDIYFGVDREVTKSETPHWKAYLKSIKKVELSAESFVSTFHEANRQQSVPVFAVTDTPFWALRDFGTELMRREYDQSASQAYTVTAEKWTKYKRSIKTLASAIETFMRRQGIWTAKSDGTPGRHSHSLQSNKGGKDISGPLTLLLYSKLDDRFDVVTISQVHGHSGGNQSASSRRK